MYDFHILNVGQGDCSIINIKDECKYNGYSIIVDLGDGIRNIFSTNIIKDKIIVCLSHSHKDHIGGLNSIFNHLNKIEEIWIPAYYKEIINVCKFVSSLKYFKTLRPNLNIQNCKDSISSFTLLQNIFNNKIITLYEGKKICNHISILNPPLDLRSLFDIEPNDFKDKLLNFDYSEIENWFDDFDEIRRILAVYIDRNNSSDTLATAEKRFIIEILNYLKNDIINFIDNPTINNFNKIYKKIELVTNDCSIMNQFNFNEFKHKVLKKSAALYTGDAGKKVFNRLIKENKLSEVEILKVPHHGSSKNISKKILDVLNPKYFIVSHDNGLFGKQKDPHPNITTINLINQYSHNILYTNNVIKNHPHILYPKPISGKWNTSPNIYFVN